MSYRSAYVHLFYLAALLYAAAASCKEGSETDCSLNGVCTSGRCACDPGWTGDRCNHLQLRPPSRAEPHGYFNATMPTWGGDIIYENGTYHAFVTAKPFTTPPFDESDNYECNTAIVRLEGETPAGPFKYVEIVLPAFHHEAHAIRAPDGTVVIYMISYDGGDFPGVLSKTCIGMPDACHLYDISHEVTAMAWSSSVYGPWKEKVILNPWPGMEDRHSWICQTNCPSVAFAANGSVVMAVRGVQCEQPPRYSENTREKIAIVTAPHWSGPYTIRSTEPLFGWRTPADWPSSLVNPTNQTMSNEDPFIWRTKRGYHMLVHCQLLPYPKTRGAYAYSVDGLAWTLLPDYAWETNMTWSDGTVSYFKRRQAPDLYLDSNGFPLYLLTPVDELSVDGCHWGHGWTLIQPIDRSGSAPISRANCP